MVKSLQLILDNHTSLLCPDNIYEFSFVFTMLGRRKKPFCRCIATVYITADNSATRDHEFNFKENKFKKKLETNFMCFASCRSIDLSVSPVTAAWASCWAD